MLPSPLSTLEMEILLTLYFQEEEMEGDLAILPSFCFMPVSSSLGALDALLSSLPSSGNVLLISAVILFPQTYLPELLSFLLSRLSWFKSHGRNSVLMEVTFHNIGTNHL